MLVEAVDNYRLLTVSGIVTARTEHLQIVTLQLVQSGGRYLLDFCGERRF
jgi:hypothetical protein